MSQARHGSELPRARDVYVAGTKEEGKDWGAGFHRTTSDFLNGFGISFSIFLAWVGVLALLAVRRHSADGGTCVR